MSSHPSSPPLGKPTAPQPVFLPDGEPSPPEPTGLTGPVLEQRHSICQVFWQFHLVRKNKTEAVVLKKFVLFIQATSADKNEKEKKIKRHVVFLPTTSALPKPFDQYTHRTIASGCAGNVYFPRAKLSPLQHFRTPGARKQATKFSNH